MANKDKCVQITLLPIFNILAYHTDVATLCLTEPDDNILSPQGQGTLTTKGFTSTYEIQLWNGLTMLKSFKTNQLTFRSKICFVQKEYNQKQPSKRGLELEDGVQRAQAEGGGEAIGVHILDLGVAVGVGEVLHGEL